MATRKPYAREFKIEAVKLVTERGLSRTQVARDLGLDISTLHRWIKEFATDPERAFPGQGHPRDEELAQLRRENELLRQERDMLKKRHDQSGHHHPMKMPILERGPWQHTEVEQLGAVSSQKS
ncbi:MAG: transposase [Chloroflexota bacterium]|nr:transposase [Chloroflexota bacterium]